VTTAEALGSLGVALLLAAYFLNLIGRLGRERRTYHVVNALGAGLSCWASWQIGFLPFVVLEGIWMLIALFAVVSMLGGDGGTRTPDTADMSRLL
jgi:hypothetical protein